MRRDLGSLLALFLAAAPVCAAQSPIGPGAVTIGGSARFGRLHDQRRRQHEVGFTISPQIGVFILRNLAVNLNGDIGWSKRDETATAFRWAAGPGVSFYFDVAKPRFFPQASLRTL